MRRSFPTEADYGVITIASGPWPTRMVATTVFVAVEMTDTSSEPRFTTYTCVPSDVIAAVAARDGRAFLIAANQGRFEIPDPGALIGFYVPDAGGANGFAPLGLQTFFVSDVSSVHDERVSSHEIGHILGLHHTLDDQDRLMFPGSNGMILTPDEITVARYVAQGLLDDVR